MWLTSSRMFSCRIINLNCHCSFRAKQQIFWKDLNSGQTMSHADSLWPTSSLGCFWITKRYHEIASRDICLATYFPTCRRTQFLLTAEPTTAIRYGNSCDSRMDVSEGYTRLNPTKKIVIDY